MESVRLGSSELEVSRICLGTMTFGEQVDEASAHAILDRSLERGVNFIDTAEMYSVPPRAETYGATETILGTWFARTPGARNKVVLASKVAGPSRGMPWIRDNPALSTQDIIRSCEGSLRRLQTEVIDLYQLHWPARSVPVFGELYYDPAHEAPALPIHEQLEAFDRLIRDGKVRHIGVSNESPYGVHEFVRLAEQHGLPRIVSVQNPYCLVARGYDNGLDETCHRLNVSLLAYSPLAFGLLTGKYDASGFTGPGAPPGRMQRFQRTREQRWGRPAALDAARRYNRLAHEHGLTPTQMALAFCYTRWSVASTIIGVTDLAQLEENLDAWPIRLSPELLAAIDEIRLEMRDPAH